MEATKKQKGFIYALHRKLGREPIEGDIEGLAAERASEWIDSLNGELEGRGKKAVSGEKKAKNPEKAAVSAVPNQGINGARFGAVCKLITQKYGIREVLARREMFLQTARELYDVFGRAEQAIMLVPKGAGLPAGGGAR